jgi:capsular exopolysaccharide synthesis family protein
MSTYYDALVKAEKGRTEPRKEELPSEPVTRSGVSKRKKFKRRIVSLKVWPEAVSEVERAEQKIHDEKTRRRVSIGSLLVDPGSVVAEQFRKLRTVITTHGVANGLRTLLITSSVPGEGKTTVALNLAGSIAQGLDDSVILVDADLRRLTLTNLLGLGQFTGLHDVLEKRASVEGSLVATEINGLSVMPGGMNPTNPAEWVGSTRMRGFIQRLKESYSGSYILIDSTPVGPTSEAGLLGEMVDGIIIVVLVGRTRREVVKRELKSINQKKILGLVLNGVESENAGYYGQQYKHYHSKEKG